MMICGSVYGMDESGGWTIGSASTVVAETRGRLGLSASGEYGVNGKPVEGSQQPTDCSWDFSFDIKVFTHCTTEPQARSSRGLKA